MIKKGARALQGAVAGGARLGHFMSTALRVRATLTYGTGGPGVHTSYWIPGTTGGVTADATDVVARVRAFFAAVQTLYPNSTTVQVQTDVAQFNDTTGGLVGTLSAASVGSVVGTGGSAIGPLASMALIRLRTGLVLNGRALRGRWYMGPLAATTISTVGGLTTGGVSAFNSAAAGLLAAGATTSVLAVWNRPGTAGGLTTGVTSASTWDQLAVLRSRRDA